MRRLLKGPAARSGGDAESRQAGVSSKTKGWRGDPGASASAPQPPPDRRAGPAAAAAR